MVQVDRAVGRSRFHLTKERRLLLYMTLPSFLLVLIFAYGPLSGWMYAFIDYKVGMPLDKCKFMGLYYVKIALTDPDLLRVLRNTLVMSVLGLLNLPISSMFAVFLSEMRGKRFKKTVQVVSTLPYFISWVIVYSLTFALVAPDSGMINQMLLRYGLIQTPVDPIANVNIAWFFQTMLIIWKGMGYNAIIFFAAITSIDQELYDAVHVDGANRWGRIRHVVLPGLVPTAVTLLLISIGNMLSNGFDQYYVFMNPLTRERIEVLDYYVYKLGMGNNDIPTATVFSIFKTFVSVVLLFGSNLISKKVRGQSIL